MLNLRKHWKGISVEYFHFVHQPSHLLPTSGSVTVYFVSLSIIAVHHVTTLEACSNSRRVAAQVLLAVHGLRADPRQHHLSNASLCLTPSSSMTLHLTENTRVSIGCFLAFLVIWLPAQTLPRCRQTIALL